MISLRDAFHDCSQKESRFEKAFIASVSLKNTLKKNAPTKKPPRRKAFTKKADMTKALAKRASAKREAFSALLFLPMKASMGPFLAMMKI